MARKLLIAFTCFLVLVALVELGFRLFESKLDPGDKLPSYRAFVLEGKSPAYQPRAHTVYQHYPNTRFHNSLGFSDREWSREGTAGVPRILCLGGSTTEGGNPRGLEGSYPYLLEELLEQETGRDFEVMNAGMSGWTSSEILVAWFLSLQDFAPDLVLFHEAINDVEPRFRADFLPDHSHWRRPMAGPSTSIVERFFASWSDLYLYMKMKRRGIPDITALTSNRGSKREPLSEQGKLPHETSLPFRRNVLSIARSVHAAGAGMALMTMPLREKRSESGEITRKFGVGEHNDHLRELAATEGCFLVDAAAHFDTRPELQAEFLDGVHVTPEGNLVKARLIADVLLERWVPGLPADGARPPQKRPGKKKRE